MVDTVNERTTSYVTTTFLDRSGVPAVPNSVTYSTRCKTTGIAIKTNVSVTPASSVVITLDAADSAIQNQANASEDKALTVRASYGSNDECNSEYLWTVMNLSGV